MSTSNKLYALLIFLCSTATASAQDGFSVFAGGTASRLRFPDFQQFVDKYNDPAYIGTDVEKPLSFQPFGFGYEAGLYWRGAGVTMGLGYSKTKTLPSYATLPEGDRCFQFSNWNYSILFGYHIAKIIMPYATFAFSACHIDAYFDYHGVKSYGSDKVLNGVYTSWKGIGTIGLRFEKCFGRWGPYVDFNYAFGKKVYLGGSFDLTTNSTEDDFFPTDPNAAGTYDVDGALHESYRNMRLSAGVVIYIFDPLAE
ncbi:MAG: hypothetical protein V4604_10035 [Bacteroidota bacterium]